MKGQEHNAEHIVGPCGNAAMPQPANTMSGAEQDAGNGVKKRKRDQHKCQYEPSSSSQIPCDQPGNNRCVAGCKRYFCGQHFYAASHPCTKNSIFAAAQPQARAKAAAAKAQQHRPETRAQAPLADADEDDDDDYEVSGSGSDDDDDDDDDFINEDADDDSDDDSDSDLEDNDAEEFGELGAEVARVDGPAVPDAFERMIQSQLQHRGISASATRANLAKERVVRSTSELRNAALNGVGVFGAGSRKKTNTNKTDPKVKAAARVKQFANHGLRVGVDGSLFCDCCNTTLALKKSTIKTHVEGKKHTEMKEERAREKGSGMTGAIARHVAANQAARVAAGEAFTLKTDVVAYRTQVCYAVLRDGIPFTFLRTPVAPLGLRRLLEAGRSNLPYREVSDCIPSILRLQLDELKKELQDVRGVGFIYDGTPHVAEVFAVVVRFVKNCPSGYRVTHRLAALRMYEKSFNGAQLAVALADILMQELGLKRDQIRASTQDGCPVNGAAMDNLRLPVMLPHLISPICISHAANVVGKVSLTALPLARQFESWWSNLLETCPRARGLFRAHSNVSAKRSSQTRWFTWWEISNQAYEHSASVRHVVFHQDDFGDELRTKLRDLINTREGDLRLEWAVTRDVGAHLVKLCYKQEGDAPLLCATTYDHHESVRCTLRRITADDTPVQELRELLPSVAQNADALGVDGATRDALVTSTAFRLRPVYDKMDGDSDRRLDDTLNVLRACRMFNYEFIARTPLPALQQEVARVAHIPLCYARLHALEGELEAYRLHALARFAVVGERVSLWDFWCAAALMLPTWWECAQEVAIIAPSSCTVERVFSMLTNMMGDQQESALEDYVAASVMVRYNDVWRGHDLGVR